MLGTLKNFLKIPSSPDFRLLLKNGAVLVDVRTKAEFVSGHIEGCLNIPLNELQEAMKKFSKNTVLITCCATGVRSESAKNVLVSMGFEKVFNGGGWSILNAKLK